MTYLPICSVERWCRYCAKVSSTDQCHGIQLNLVVTIKYLIIRWSCLTLLLSGSWVCIQRGQTVNCCCSKYGRVSLSGYDIKISTLSFCSLNRRVIPPLYKTQHESQQVTLFVIFVLFLGTNVEKAKHILTESGMPLIPADDMDDAARKAVISLVDWCYGCRWNTVRTWSNGLSKHSVCVPVRP